MPRTPNNRTRLEFTQYISPDGQVYRFDNMVDQFVLAGVSGMGLPPITYRTQRGPFQDGVTPLGFSFEPRIVQLLHRREAGCRTDYWTNRSDILNILRPNRQTVGTFKTGVLRKILPDRALRDLDVFIDRSLAFEGIERGSWDEFSFTEAIQFIAHNPMFYDPEEQREEITIPSYGDELAFPVTFPISFSSNANVPVHSITYPGTYKSFPKIILIGPMKDPAIRNITTGDFIKLQTTLASLADSITIDLEFGNKTIVDNFGNNLIGSLTTDSDLGTFNLAPAPTAPLGVNDFGVSVADITADTKIIFKWFNRYIGI